MSKSSLIPLLTALAFSATAQQPTALTTSNYAHAESFMNYNTAPLIDNGAVIPNWLPGDSFWYRNLNPKGFEFILVNPVKRTVSGAFDQQKLAAALSTATLWKAIVSHLTGFTSKGGQHVNIDERTRSPKQE